MPPSIWPDNTLGTSLSLLIDSVPATCVEFPSENLLIPFVVKVATEKFKGIKRLAVIHENLRDTMDPCNGMPFLIMTQTGAENISDTRCRPYCGRATRCSLYNKHEKESELQEYNTTSTVDVECHCWSADGCSGIFLQISLTSLVNRKAAGKLCEIDLSSEQSRSWKHVDDIQKSHLRYWNAFWFDIFNRTSPVICYSKIWQYGDNKLIDLSYKLGNPFSRCGQVCVLLKGWTLVPLK